MRKIFLLFIGIIATSALWAADFIVDGIAYTQLGGDSVEVIQKDSAYSGAITIPDMVTYSDTTYRVTGIGEDAFYGCGSLTAIMIPNSVSSIGDKAFAWCYSLTTITIPNSVRSIGQVVFSGCTSLSSIDVDAANTYYASVDGVLFNYAKDTLIQYPTGNTRTSYAIPDGVIRIKDRAFYYCTSLSFITLPSSVTSIEWWAFAGCSSLSSIIIPDSVSSIEAFTFSDCSSLGSITFGNHVSSIGNLAFSGCNSLTSIMLPNSVDSIADRAFSYCPSLRSVTLPSSLTTLGWGAFYECDSIRSITCYATTPPACGMNCFYNVDTTIPVYVPTGSVDAYKAADTWKEFTTIQAIPDDPTALDQLTHSLVDNARCTMHNVNKFMHNNRLLIERSGHTYTMTGQEL